MDSDQGYKPLVIDIDPQVSKSAVGYDDKIHPATVSNSAAISAPTYARLAHATISAIGTTTSTTSTTATATTTSAAAVKVNLQPEFDGHRQTVNLPLSNNPTGHKEQQKKCELCGKVANQILPLACEPLLSSLYPCQSLLTTLLSHSFELSTYQFSL